MELVVAPLARVPDEGAVEAVERKGLGHPDTICDALAEELSRALLRHYVERFGAPLHHNVDKLLLVAGRARPAFGGGEVLEPIEIVLAGRAVLEWKGVRVPVAEIATRTCRAWLSRNVRGLDPERHVRIRCLVRPGSSELVELFGRAGAPFANDTSCGIGFAPLTPLERGVKGLERALNATAARDLHPECGEDVKVMGVRSGRRVEVTLACAMVGRHLPDLAAYRDAKRALEARARAAFLGAWSAGGGRALAGEDLLLFANAADDEANGQVYLTVTGTSAEAGDDGEVGRGNRVNGLITFDRPMSLEAAAGKNPVSHVGKLYNILAGDVALDLVALPDVASAECRLVSRIGAPVAEPSLAEVRLRTRGRPVGELSPAVAEILRERLRDAGGMWRRILEGAVEVF
ncbi:MAG TPA: methionine adenosyltransferase [Planctomycetota bacterium]|nr:methionine adenosyltransferase [Planctomycetota bacterium]